MEPKQLTTQELYRVLTAVHNRRHQDAEFRLAQQGVEAAQTEFEKVFREVGLDPNTPYDISPEGLVTEMAPQHLHSVPPNRAARRRKVKADAG